MAKLGDTVVNGDLRVTGTLYGTGQYFVVESSDVNAFAKILDAYNKKKTIILHSYNSSTGIHLWVPLTRANVNSSGVITQFAFSKPVAYGSNIGMIENWSISNTSTTGFIYNASNGYYAQYAVGANYAVNTDYATSVGTALTCSSCTETARATYAVNDANGNRITTTYATANDVNFAAGWMLVDGNDYTKRTYDGSTLNMAQGTLSSQSTTHYIEDAIYTAGTTYGPVNRIQIHSAYMETSEQIIVPGRVTGGNIINENVLYTVCINNFTSSSIPVKVGAGGCWGTTKYTGVVCFNGTLYPIDTSDIASWSSGKRNLVTIKTLSRNAMMAFELNWYRSTETISGTTYTKHIVYVNTLW